MMNKHLFSLVFIAIMIFSVSAGASVESTTVPEPFQRSDDSSDRVIDYTDVNSLLDALVLDTGRSDRKKASPQKQATGTRMKFSVNRATVNEGNRFYFEVFEDNDRNRQMLRRIRDRLESIPFITPLEKYSRDEQLAYWLNLYNVTILDEIVKIYPQRKLEDYLGGKESILAKKTLIVAGIPLSLNDIQFTILKQNYNSNPLVIYGLYQGIIGGPNIRKTAYTGKYVYGDLIENAMEFINSNRGTEGKNSKVFRVSAYYQRNSAFFPDFQQDLREHLLTYLEGEELNELKTARTLKADISDWSVTDLYGNNRNLAGSFGTNSAALAGAASGENSSRYASQAGAASRYSPAVLAHLQALKRKKEAEKTGTVTIEELGQVEEESNR
ncbi:MAG: DUF547 domain-containing protein [Xanthomonadales bacterium]|nr:DUF547 domain-containing protein [Gammaproteobacteria bacterium]NNK03257.1 DUF547 domain-containing protein [Xanthomonadales bacterium]